MKTRLFKVFLLASVFYIGLFSGNSRGAGEIGSFAGGFVIGSPSGFSFKKWLGRHKALDGTLSFLMKDKERFYANINLVIHDHDFLLINAADTPVYYGGGIVFRIVEDDGVSKAALGLRGVGGVEYLFPYKPIGVFFDLGPVIQLAPEMRLILTGGVGLRYYF